MRDRIEVDGQVYVVSGTQFVYTSTLASSIVIPGQVLLYGFTASSTNSAAQFIQLFDGQSVPADATVPIAFFPVAATSQAFSYYGSRGRRFTGGIVLCTSSTAGTKTIGSADTIFDVQYARLLDDTGEV